MRPILLFTLDAQTIVYGVLALFVIIGVIAYRRNYIIQIKISLLMDSESSVYNKDGIKVYLKKHKSLKKPTFVSININNLGQLYTNYKDKSSLMYNIATLILRELNNQDTIARADFDKFVLVIPRPEGYKDMLNKIEERFRNYEIPNYGKYNFQIEFGVYKEVDMKRSLECLDLTTLIPMFSSSRDQNIFYYTDEVFEASNKIDRINKLKLQAIQSNQFEVAITPRVHFTQGHVVGGKLSVKWVNDSRVEMFSQSDYLPIFVQSGFISEYDGHIFEKACELLGSLQARGIFNQVISLEFSKESFNNINFFDKLSQIMQRYAVNPNNLVIEITESSLASGEVSLSNAMHKLKTLGLKVGVGAFGRENAAIITIIENSLDYVCIDKFFFSNAIHSEREGAILNNIIRMLEKTRTTICCCGIESKAVLDKLATMTINVVIQGSIITNPLNLTAFADFAMNNKFSYDYKPPVISEVGANTNQQQIPLNQQPKVAVEVVPEVKVVKTETDPNIELLKKQLAEIKANMESPNNNKQNTNNELLMLMKQMEELKYLAANSNSRTPSRDYEIELLKMQIEQLRNGNNQNNYYRGESEIERLRRELADIKANAKSKEEEDEMKRLKLEIERVREKDDYEKRKEIERIREKEEYEKRKALETLERERQEREKLERERQHEQEELKRLQAELAKKDQEKLRLEEENAKKFAEAKRLEIEKAKEAEARKLAEENNRIKEELLLEKRRLEAEQLRLKEQALLEKRKQEEKALLEQKKREEIAMLEKKRLEAEQAKLKEEMLLEQKRLEESELRKKIEAEYERKKLNEELEKARLEKELLESRMNELLASEDANEEEDDDYGDDEEEEEEEVVARELMDLSIVEATVQVLRNKYQDKWEIKAPDDLKGNYDDFLYSLEYYRMKLRKTVADKVLTSKDDLKVMYNTVKNEIMKYSGITNKITNKYDMFYLEKNQVIKVAVTKTKVRVYMDLDPSKYSEKQFPHRDMSDKKAHSKTPFLMMLKSPLSFKRFAQLCSEVMLNNKVKEDLKYKKVNYLKELEQYKTKNIIF